MCVFLSTQDLCFEAEHATAEWHNISETSVNLCRKQTSLYVKGLRISTFSCISCQPSSHRILVLQNQALDSAMRCCLQALGSMVMIRFWMQRSQLHTHSTDRHSTTTAPDPSRMRHLILKTCHIASRYG